MTPSAAIAVLLLAVISAGPQEEGRKWKKQECKEYSLKDLNNGTIPLDKPAYVDGKYASYFDQRLHDLASSAKLVVKDWDPSEVIRALKRGDNIRVYGVFGGPAGKPGGTFFVYDLDRLPDDDEQFRRRRAKLVDGDWKARLDLGDWAKKRYENYGSWAEQMKDKARAMFREGIRILEDEAKEDDFDTHLQITGILLHQVENRQEALKKLKETCLKLRPDDAGLRRFLLEDLRATWYRGEWVLYEDFKQKEGFVRRDGEGVWIREPIVLLEEFAAEVAELPAPLVDRQTFQIKAKQGVAAKGMSKYFVVQAISYPSQALKLERAKGDLEIWVYRDAYLFFNGGVLWKDPKKR